MGVFNEKRCKTNVNNFCQINIYMSYFQIKGRETLKGERTRDNTYLNDLWVNFQSGNKLTINYLEIGPGSGYDREDWGDFVIFKQNGIPPVRVDLIYIEVYENNRRVHGYERCKKLFSSFSKNFEATLKLDLLQTKQSGFDFNQRIFKFIPTKSWRTADQRYAFMAANAHLDTLQERGLPLPEYVEPQQGQLDGQKLNETIGSRDLHRRIAEYLDGGKRKRKGKGKKTRRKNNKRRQTKRNE
jgi:hypothetical protein